jgi:methyl-accepting chemotaxis protein
MQIGRLMRMAVAAFLAVGCLALGWNELRFRGIANADSEQTAEVEAMRLLKDMRYHVAQIQQFLTDVAATHDDGGYDEAREHLAAAATAAGRLATLRPAFASRASDLAQRTEHLHDLGVRMARAYVESGIAAGNAIMKQPGTGFDDTSAALAEQLDAAELEASQSLAAARAATSREMLWVRISGAAVVVAMIVAVGLLMSAIGRAVLPPLARLRAGLEALRDDRNSDVRLEGLGPDFAPVGAVFNEVMANLRDSAQRTQRRAEDICDNTRQITSRAGGQAAHYEETAASMEELTSAVKANEQSALEARRLVNEASDSAEQGRHVVGDAVAAMQKISAASRRIGEIIGLIDELAFQTNLLALNAAVEAARAGEQGRGFAVVAAEVRTLAGRSAEAARQIKSLINESLGRVDEGAQLVSRSGESLERIAGSVTRVAEVIARITEACNEQSQEIDVVNRALAEIDALTQQNLQLFTEAADTADSMLTALRGERRDATRIADAQDVDGAAPLAVAA